MRSALILLALLGGCVSPSQMMVSNDGRMARCAASGWGYIGAPLAYHTVSTCVSDYESIGYRKMKKDD